jgi:hypothetical protein
MSALCSILLAHVHRGLPTVCTVQHFACSGTQIFAHCQHCAPHCLMRYTGTCPLSVLYSTLLAQVHRNLPTVSTVDHIPCSGTQGLAHCQHCAAPCLLKYTGTCPLSAMCSTLLLRYTGTCPLSALCTTLLAQVHRDLPTVSTLQHIACLGTQGLAHCQHCAPHCLLRYTGTCPLSAMCTILLVEVHRYLPTVSTVQHLACSGTQGLAHCQHCAATCLLRYTGTCPLSALCCTLLAHVHSDFWLLLRKIPGD